VYLIIYNRIVPRGPNRDRDLFVIYFVETQGRRQLPQFTV